MNNELRRITRADALAQGFSDRQIAQLVRMGTIHRIRPGEFALSEEWTAVRRHEQHRQLVLRTVERVSGAHVYSHFAAAALWGIRILGRWPKTVDVVVSRAKGGRSSGLLHRHALGFEGREIVELDGLTVTSPAQTVVDLARVLPFVDGVVAADSALGTAFGRRRLTTPEELHARIDDAGRARGAARARAVAAQADGRAESPPETVSRVGSILLGFPHPEPQKEFRTSRGQRRLDLWWKEFGLGGECDGQAKYSDPEYLNGRTPQEAFRDEKLRDRELLALAEVSGIIHWDPADLNPPAKFYDILRGAGLPSRFGRPTFASWSGAESGLVNAVARRFAR